MARIRKVRVDGHFCLIPDLGRKIQSFSIKHDDSYRFFVDSLYRLKKLSIFSLLNVFSMNEYCISLVSFVSLLI